MIKCIATFAVCVALMLLTLEITESHLTYTKRPPGLAPHDRYVLRSLMTYLLAGISSIMLVMTVLCLRQCYRRYDEVLRRKS